MAPFWPILTQNAQKQRFFAFFFENRALEFPNFLHEAQSLESKKNYVFDFLGKIQKWSILAKIDPNLVISGLIRRHFKSFVVKNFEILFCFQKSKTNYFGRTKSTFHHFDPPYDLPLPTLRTFLKCLNLRFFAFLSKTMHWNFLIFCMKPSLWSRKK